MRENDLRTGLAGERAPCLGLCEEEDLEACVDLFAEVSEDVVCEACHARRARGTFNVGGVETVLCGGCSQIRDCCNKEILFEFTFQ